MTDVGCLTTRRPFVKGRTEDQETRHGTAASAVSFWMGALGVLLLTAAGQAQQGGADNVARRLATMPQPWKKKVHRITPDEYEGTLRHWTEKHPDFLMVESVGTSAEGAPIYLLKVTDASVPDRNKQVCLITALHGGPERNGTTSILHLTEWLLADSPGAAETRRKQIVLLMPIVNPYAYFVTDRFGNSKGIDPYTGGGQQNWDLQALTYKALDKSPEIAAFLSVVDRYRPEVHADLHGIGLQEYPQDKLGDRHVYQGQTMFEVTGSAYSNFSLRPWDWRVIEAMVAAGVEAGYGSDRFEADAQREFWGPDRQPIADRLWLGRPRFYTAQYAYAKYHTMVSAFEIGWEQSAVARLRGLLRIGNSVWEGEPVAGYPVDRVRSFCGHLVAAWGETAEQRRRSRVELWRRQGSFTLGMLYPQTDGRDTFCCAVGPEAGKLLDPDEATCLTKLATVPGVDAGAIKAFVDAGPEIKFHVDRGCPVQKTATPTIQHGLALRLRLAYRNPELVDLRLNGHCLKESRTNGFERWYADGYTQVQVNVSPDKTRQQQLFVITCAYKPDAQRTYGWTPPREVTERLKSAKP